MSGLDTGTFCGKLTGAGGELCAAFISGAAVVIDISSTCMSGSGLLFEWEDPSVVVSDFGVDTEGSVALSGVGVAVGPRALEDIGSLAAVFACWRLISAVIAKR